MASPASPQFPGLAHHDPLLDDAKVRHERLQTDNKRLFSDSNDISVDVIDVARTQPGQTKEVSQTTITDCTAFEQCLQEQRQEQQQLLPPPANCSRFYVLKPSKLHVVSRSRLHITEPLARALLATHRVMPSFLDHLHGFGRREKRERDASFGGGRYRLGFDATGALAEYELCYTFKFGVNNGRKERYDPYLWSIRQTSVYQKFCYDAARATWILVQPALSVQRRLVNMLASNGPNGAAQPAAEPAQSAEGPADPARFNENPLMLHLLFLSAAAEGWREYYNHLEDVFFHITKAAVNIAVQHTSEQQAIFPPATATGPHGPTNPLEMFEVGFEDVQNLQRLEELLRRVKTALDINEDSIRSLRSLNTALRHHALPHTNCSTAAWAAVDLEAEQQLAILAAHKRNFVTLLENVHGRGQLMYNVLDFKNALTVSFTSQRAVDINYLQQNESTIMSFIQEMSVRDAMGVKILTLLATLYVPASFVATFLAAGVVTFDNSHAGSQSLSFKRMSFSRESFIFYIAFTVALMVVTYGCWWLWVQREGKQVDERFKTALLRANTLETEKGRSRALTGLSASQQPALSLPFHHPPPTRQNTFMSIISSSTVATSPPLSPVYSPFGPLSARSTMTR